MAFEHMLDRNKQPNGDEIQDFVGQPLGGLWVAFDSYLKEAYAVEPQPCFSPKSGWSFRYRKGSRPLCEIIPEHGAFTVLVVLGAKEAAQALTALETFAPNVRGCLENARAFHDGRWLWIRVQGEQDIADIQRLILLKRKPVKK